MRGLTVAVPMLLLALAPEAISNSVAPREKTPAGLPDFPEATVHGEPSMAWRRWQSAELPPIRDEGIIVNLNCSFLAQPFMLGDIPPLGGMLRCAPIDDDDPAIAPYHDAAAIRAIQYVFDLSAVPRERRRDRRDVRFAVKFAAEEQRPLDLTKSPVRPRADFEWTWGPELKAAEFYWTGLKIPADAKPHAKLTCQVQADLTLACEGLSLDPEKGPKVARDAIRAATEYVSASRLTTGEPAEGAVTQIWVRAFDRQ